MKSLQDANPAQFIKIVNYSCNTNFPLDAKIKFADTESSKVKRDDTKFYVRDDLIASIDDDPEIKVIVEFQSKFGDDRGYTMFVYSANHLIKDTGTKIYSFPHAVTIYTDVNHGNNINGFDVLKFSIPKEHSFTLNGNTFDVGEEKIGKWEFPYINLFRMELEDIQKSDLAALQVLYLYRFVQNEKLITLEHFTEVVNSVSNYANSCSNTKERNCYIEFLANLEKYIIKLTQTNPKYKEASKVMENYYVSHTDILRRESKLEGKLESKLETLWETAPFMLKHAPLKEVVNHFLQKIDLPRQEIVERLTEIAKEQQAKEFESIFDENGNVIPYSGDGASVEMGE